MSLKEYKPGSASNGVIGRMLKKEGSHHGRLEKYLWEAIDQARDEVLKEWGW